MKKVLKAGVRFLIAIILGLVYMWFLLTWSLDEMSLLEKCLGIIYGFVMVPLYYKLTDAMGLR